MDLDQVRTLLRDAALGLEIAEERRLPSGLGTQLLLKNGGIVNVYGTGKFNVQGKMPRLVRLVLGEGGPTP